MIDAPTGCLPAGVAKRRQLQTGGGIGAGVAVNARPPPGRRPRARRAGRHPTRVPIRRGGVTAMSSKTGCSRPWIPRSIGNTRDSPSPTAGTDRTTPDWCCRPTPRAGQPPSTRCCWWTPFAPSGNVNATWIGYNRLSLALAPSSPRPFIHQTTKEKPEPPRPAKTRFFGSNTLNPDFYARDFGRITSEVIQHLAAVDGVELEVRLARDHRRRQERVRRGQGPHYQRKRPDTQIRAVRLRSRVRPGGHGGPSSCAVGAEVPVQGRPADSQVLGDVHPGVAVGLHPLRGGDVLAVDNLAGSSELRAVGAG